MFQRPQIFNAASHLARLDMVSQPGLLCHACRQPCYHKKSHAIGEPLTNNYGPSASSQEPVQWVLTAEKDTVTEPPPVTSKACIGVAWHASTAVAHAGVHL